MQHSHPLYSTLCHHQISQTSN